VYGLEFDSTGRPRDYRVLLTNTTRNCNGGPTPWGTWVSCEETRGGQCWQVDPTAARESEVTKLGGPEGGNFEAFVSDPVNRNFFVTEDSFDGAVRRYRPGNGGDGGGEEPFGWNTLHGDGGTIDYLEFVSSSEFRWTDSIDAGRFSAASYYKNAEGIAHHDGVLLFVSKKQKELFILDLSNGTYAVESTQTGQLDGGGSFGAGPDHVLWSCPDGLAYFTEDGSPNPGIFAYDGVSYRAVLEAFREDEYGGDETTGIDFSPDGMSLFFAVQGLGRLFQVRRLDGLSFESRRCRRRRRLRDSVLKWKYDLGRS